MAISSGRQLSGGRVSPLPPYLDVSLSLSARHISGFDELVRNLPADAVASPSRSTLPLVDFWRSPASRLVELEQMLGLPLHGPIELAFEYPVAVRRGRGKASYTDLMVIANQAAVAIEGKFTEPPYETVAAWLRSPAEPNRAEVLNGWLGLIADVTSRTLSLAAVADLPYQLIHRTASVCAVERPNRAVVYQLFGHVPEYYQQSIERLRDRLEHTAAIGLHVWPRPARSTSAHASLQKRWAEKDPSVGIDVRAALLAGPLFSFDEA